MSCQNMRSPHNIAFVSVILVNWSRVIAGLRYPAQFDLSNVIFSFFDSLFAILWVIMLVKNFDFFNYSGFRRIILNSQRLNWICLFFSRFSLITFHIFWNYNLKYFTFLLLVTGKHTFIVHLTVLKRARPLSHTNRLTLRQSFVTMFLNVFLHTLERCFKNFFLKRHVRKISIMSCWFFFIHFSRFLDLSFVLAESNRSKTAIDLKRSVEPFHISS